MKKTMLALSVIALGLGAFAGEKIAEYTLPNVKAELVESAVWPDRSYLAIDDGEYISPYEPEGAPQIPYRVLKFAVPDGYQVKSVTSEGAEWTTLQENARILPIQTPTPTFASTPAAFVELDPKFVLNAPYPVSPVEKLATYTQNGIDLVSVKVTPFRWNPISGLLEQARNLKVVVTFSSSTSNLQPKGVVNPILREWTRKSVVNPSDLPPEPMKLMSDDDSKSIYLIIAPSDLYDDWVWYAGERAKNHPDISFDVVNTADIYRDYPYRNVRQPESGPITDLGEDESRYPCESIWKWLVAYRTQHPTLQYVVLGGLWLDVTDPVVHYTQEGNEIGINNAVPSVKVCMRNPLNPTDMYYACLKAESGDTPHHWDENNNGTYLEGSDGNTEYSHCSMEPVVAVSRMSMKPIVMGDNVEINPEFDGGNHILNQHQLIRNFLYKVNRAEGNGIVGTRIVDGEEVYDYAEPNFHGNFKLGITSSSLSYKDEHLNSGLMQRDELYFFDRAPNMYAPEHTDVFCDVGPMLRRHASELIATRRPVIDAMSFHSPSTVSDNATKDAFSSFFGAHDRELGTVDGHGWAGGTGQFNTGVFSACKGLTKVNVVGSSCETGYLDIYGNQNGKSVANLCLGESGCANPTATGGVIASMNNSRFGWNGGHSGSYRGPDGLSSRLHYYMVNGLANGLNAGDAWLQMAIKYLGLSTSHHRNSTGGQCYTEEMLFGDPLIKFKEIKNYTWNGGASGDWTYNDADAVTFNAAATVNVDKYDEDVPYGAMSLVINQNAGDTFKFTGDGGLKVMRGVTVSGGNLEIGISGGIGGVVTYDENSEANTAKRENYLKFTNPGKVIFNDLSADANFFVNGIKNASEIVFAGAGAILNTDQLDASKLTFQGPEGFDPRTAPANVIRANTSKAKGALKDFMPLTLTNSALTLETYDAFNGYSGTDFMMLNNSILKYRINRWRGLADLDYERVKGKLYLNDSTLAVDYPCSVYLTTPTIEVTGNSSIETTNGGAFRLFGTTAIELKDNATVTIDAEFDLSENGSFWIKGNGRAIIANPKGLAGRVYVDNGVTLELGELPLTDVTELTLVTNTKVVLPHEKGNFYQILPLSSALKVAEGADVKVYSKSGDEETLISAELTQTGSIFESGTLLEWVDAEGVWSRDQSAKPWIKNGVRTAFNMSERAYFPDVKDSSGNLIGEATVSVAEKIESPFTCFANKATAYTFNRSSMESAQDATITFDSLVIGAVARFSLPTIYGTRLYVSAGGRFTGTEVTTPLIEVDKDGVLAAGTIGTTTTTPTAVNVEKGGTLVLTGENHSMNLTLRTGAKLKPDAENPLVWSDTININWPSGKVIVDVSEWEATNEPVVIIQGIGADMDWISHLEPSEHTISLAVVDGDVCLVRCDTYDSPFTLELTSVTTDWDTGNWYANGTKFAKKWSESYPNWLATGEITVAQDNAELDLGVGASFDTLTFKTSLQDAGVKLVLSDTGSLMAREVHFDAFAKAEITNLELGNGVLYAATDTRIRGKWSGVLGATSNSSVYIYDPDEIFKLDAGFQGTIYFGVSGNLPPERKKIIQIAGGATWPLSKVTIVPIDPTTGEVIDDCEITGGGEWIYLVPPPPTAHAPAGETNWSELTWVAFNGSAVTIFDWNEVYWAKIISDSDEAVVVMDAAPTERLMVGEGSKLVLKANNAIQLPRKLELAGELTVQGAMLPTLDYVHGAGKLVLDTGDITELPITSNVFPIDESVAVEIKANSTLRLAQSVNFTSKTTNLSGFTGAGTLEIKDITGSSRHFVMPAPAKTFSSELSLALNTILELQDAHKDATINVHNFSGSGTFDFGNNNAADKSNYALRTLRTCQTKATEWSGVLPKWMGFRNYGTDAADLKIVVTGVDSASFDHRLIYSGVSLNEAVVNNRGCDHDIEIESTGCLELNGYWNGNIINNGILILGRHRDIRGNTSFQGSGRVAVMGEKIDLIANPVLGTQYSLASGTYGEIDFNISSFDENTEIMRVEEGFALPTGHDLILAAKNGDDCKWQTVTSENIQDGKLVWLADAGQDADAITFDLKSGNDNDFNALIGGRFLGGAPQLIINGNADGTSYLDATSQIGLFGGTLVLNNATVKCVSPLKSTLGANPTGKLVFVVDEVMKNQEQVLMKLGAGFTYDPENFTVEVVGADGEPTDAYWTWTTQDGELKYVIVDPTKNNHMPRGFKFDKNLAGWGTNSTNLGTPTEDKFVESRDGNAITDHNPWGGDFEIGGNDWSVTWSARLSPTENGLHFTLGDNQKNSGGFSLTTVDANHAAISRWINGGRATRLIEGEVRLATTRFNAYALTYRKGLYTFYINGVKVGESMDVENAPAYPAKVNWQFFTVHGGNVGNTASGSNGAIDDWRLYNVALSENTIRAIAAEFPPWPDAINAEGKEIWVDVNDAYVNLLVEGSGIIHLTHRKGEPNIAKISGIAGDATIILEDDLELTVDMSADNRAPLAGHSVVVGENARLILRQTSDMTADDQSLRGVDLSNITGAGTLELKSDNLKYSLKVGSSVSALSLCVNTKVVLDNGYTESAPLVVNNLSGAGTFTFSGSGAAFVNIVQSKRSVFAGSFPAQARVRIVGNGDELDGSAALVLNPSAALPQNVEIRTAANGVLAIADAANLKQATIVNEGLVVFEPDAETTINLNDLVFGGSESPNKIALSGGGVLSVAAGTQGFELKSNPMGTLQINGLMLSSVAQSVIMIPANFTYSQTLFHVSVPNTDKKIGLLPEDGYLKVRIQLSKPITILVR